MKDVIVYVEHTGGKPRRVSLEIATKARELAAALGGSVHAVVLGKDAKAASAAVKSYPVDTLHVTEDPDVDAFLVDPQVDYLEAVAKSTGPALVLVPNTMIGRDVGSRLAARLGAGLTSDIVDLSVDGGRVACVSPKLGGLTITTCAFKGDYGVASIRPNAFKATPGAGAGAVVELAKPAGKTYAMRIHDEVVEAAGELGVEEVVDRRERRSRGRRSRAVQNDPQGSRRRARRRGGRLARRGRRRLDLARAPGRPDRQDD